MTQPCACTASKGEMLSAMTAVQGSAGYVAIEQLEGILSGKKGSFLLQYLGIIDAGKDRLILEIIPDSATGELAGLVGSMVITSKDSQRLYQLEYQLL